MRKLILLGDGDFGPALLESTKTITGLVPDADTFAIAGNDRQTVRDSMNSICNTVYLRDSLLILCDFSMSSAVQEAWLVLEKRGMIGRMVMISGANVPCVTAAIRFKDEIAGDQELADTLTAEARSGIKAIVT